MIRTALSLSLLFASSASVFSQTAPFAPSFEFGYLPCNLISYTGTPSANCTGGLTFVNTTQTLAPGSHNLVFKLYDANGNVSTAQKTISVP
jgi:hypothetical protein